MPDFRLLRLPLVALKECLKIMNPLELLNLSMCSRRVSKLIKLGGTSSLEVSYMFLGSDTKQIEIGTSRSIHRFEFPASHTIPILIRQRTADFLVAVSQKPEKASFGWNGSSLELVDYILDTFNCPIHSISSGSIYPYSSLVELTNWVLTRQSTIREMSVTTRNLDGEGFKEILDKLTVTEHLDVLSKLNPDFQYTFKKFPRSISFDSPYWINLEQLLASDCESITLSNSFFTNTDLDAYFEKWKNGDYPNLKSLRIVSDRLDDLMSIAGVAPPVREENNPEEIIRDIYVFSANFIRYRIHGGVRIKNTKGITGIIKMGMERDGMQVTFLVVDLFDLVG
ncbi:hypothetical protein GCK72_011297 [Caenorhabditis remanei]|uniref:F-box domain-containing protein n=1 Tax=Caenorhabditis remanei TaxID=31234 RepID=A0A6A5H9E9_CAERE|nr:hypothetical protein GCK72_011297 [Caenorhabditis remanei]KAF1763032.1 hypothetical protein GCK72_011297 [Caenorhabditis remanei]